MRIVIAIGLLAIVTAAVLVYFTFRPRLPPAERGRRLAEAMGCFGCHGPGGLRGTPNPGRKDETVPNFEGDVMMFAETREEIHEWIHEGMTKERSESKTWRNERERGVLKMPAFKGRVSERQMEDLVAFVMATSGTEAPKEPLSARGLERVEALGCTGCHGAGGRFAIRNPGSLKGYVPSWDGADFPDLVRDQQEFEEWVRHGVSRRFDRNPLAQYFLQRATLQMPAYEEHLEAHDLDAMWAYVEWLRSPRVEIGGESHKH